MHDLSPESLASLELGGIALLVAVVTRAHEDEACADRDGISRVLALCVNCPARIAARPVDPRDAVTVANMRIDAALGRGFLDVIQDRRAVRNCLPVAPGFEVVTECVHVAVGANAGEAKQVPGPAHGIATFEDDVGLAPAFVPQVTRRTDARQSGTDNQHIKVFAGHVSLRYVLD